MSNKGQGDHEAGFDVNLALKVGKLVHEKCKDVPHDIGVDIARMVQCHEKEKMPEWMNVRDADFAKRLWCERKIDGVKYLRQVAKENHPDYGSFKFLSWVQTFLENYTLSTERSGSSKPLTEGAQKRNTKKEVPESKSAEKPPAIRPNLLYYLKKRRDGVGQKAKLADVASPDVSFLSGRLFELNHIISILKTEEE